MNFTGGVCSFAHAWEWWVELRLVAQLGLKISLEGTGRDLEECFYILGDSALEHAVSQGYGCPEVPDSLSPCASCEDKLQHFDV